MHSDFCSLCFGSCDSLSKPIEEDTKEALAQLLPHLHIKTRSDLQVICTNCAIKLRGYMEFKTRFLQTQACVQSFNSEHDGGLLDLGQVYLQNEGSGCEVSAKDLVVCRFCLKQATGAYMSLVKDQKELILVTTMMSKCFPQLDLGTISGCVICVVCHEALEGSYNFITNWKVESPIKEEATEETKPDLKAVLFELEGFGSEIGCVNFNLNVVKEEDDWLSSNVAVFDGGVEEEEGSFEQTVEQKLEENCEVKIEAVHSEGSRDQAGYDGSEGDVKIKEEDVEIEDNSLSLFKDDACDVKEEQTATESYATACSCSAAQLETIYKCDVCSYSTKYTCNYKRHIIVHKSLKEVIMYKCESCEFETRYKNNLAKHQVSHKNPSEVFMYKCKSCTFATKYKTSLARHQLSHKNLSEVPTYKCDLCSYASKDKSNYKRHTLMHERLGRTSTRSPRRSTRTGPKPDKVEEA